MDINYSFITGRLTKDPELRYTPNGVAVCSFTVATERNFTNSGGKRETDFHDIVVWREQGESCANYLRKGQEVTIVGSLQYRYYQPDGSQRRIKIAEIIAREVKFGQAPKGQGQHTTPTQNANPNSNPNTLPFPSGNSRTTQDSRRSNERYPNLESKTYDPFADPFEGESTPIHIDDDQLPF